MKAVIICGGSVGEYIKKYVKSDDFVICADSGYDRAMQYGIKADIVIGDMDSVLGDVKTQQKIVYPSRKDYTDSELAVLYAKEHGFCEILMFGMTGTRMDHTLANISLLKQLKDVKACIVDANNEIYLLTNEITLNGECGDLISVVPFDGDVSGITTDGLDYELDNGVIKSGTSLGVSNVMTKSECRITIKKGTAFVIRSRD